MSTFFGDSIYEHPVVKRLRQQVQELERDNESLRKKNGEIAQQLDRAIEYTKNEHYRASEAEAKLRSAEEKIADYEDEMEIFNKQSIFYKMFYHFDIDKE